MLICGHHSVLLIFVERNFCADHDSSVVVMFMTKVVYTVHSTELVLATHTSEALNFVCLNVRQRLSSI